MTDINGVLFDLDGLLIDTEGPFMACWKLVCAEHGYTVDEAMTLQMVGLGVREEERLFKTAYGENFPFLALRDETFECAKTLHEKEGMRVMPGARELLARLKEKRLPLCLATGTMYERTLWKLRISGLEGIFDAITTGSDVDKGKPAPDIFLTAARKIGVAPEYCVGFEDSPVGLEALAAAGIRSVFVKDIIEPAPEVLQTVWKRFDTLHDAVGLFP
jgi:HAD superfamily hydrolase (TIGR01509 family)